MIHPQTNCLRCGTFSETVLCARCFVAAMDRREEDRSPAKGAIIGAVIGLLLWAALAVFAWWFL